MSPIWGESELQLYIANSIPESLNLDYKASGSLAKTDDKRREITKDVSAMANSDGGVIIYGISENKTVSPPVPDQITPIDASVISKEWLEQVINNIRPRLDGVVIYPVQLSSATNHFAYVVEIPKSTTAHQAMDKRYYKRFNFLAEAMEHYEILDVMARNQHPKVELTFEIRPKYTANQTGSLIDNRLVLAATIRNSGVVFAQYIQTFIHVPKGIYGGPMIIGLQEIKDAKGNLYTQHSVSNISGDKGGVLLPQVSRTWFELGLREDFDIVKFGELMLIWRIHVDNASPVEDTKLLKELPFTDIDP